jgi:acetyl esterase/lipase
MKKQIHILMSICILLALTLATQSKLVYGQLSDTAAWAAQSTIQYQITPDITYLVANDHEAKLDVYRPQNNSGPTPTLIYIHGGGWVFGDKSGAVMQFIPYLEMGWAVVNVEYRLARVSLAPAAVEDCRCALRWVISKAKEYNFDTEKLVVTGHSAGGHLSLMTGMLPESAGLDRQCPGNNENLKVAAIINWFGITDVADILEGPNMQTYAVAWLGSMTNRVEVARRVSPLTYVRPSLPPILTIHGDADKVVPYSHAVRLHDALNRAGVPNQLVTIPGGKHGGFSKEETLKVFSTIREFLIRQKILTN